MSLPSNSEQAGDGGNSNPSEISNNSGSVRLVIEPIKEDISEIKSDIKGLNTTRHDNFIKLLMIYGGGFILLSGMIISSYLLLDDKISTVSDLSIKVDAKLEELIKRIPPVQTPPPGR